ncbi:hypothetical protein Q604_UNBc4C00177G0001, partial [human gut metagenome]
RFFYKNIQKNRFNVLTRKIIIGKISYVINTDYKLDKRIDGIEANCVCSALRINYNWELSEKRSFIMKNVQQVNQYL